MLEIHDTLNLTLEYEKGLEGKENPLYEGKKLN
jgi:hypothetical protein